METRLFKEWKLANNQSKNKEVRHKKKEKRKKEEQIYTLVKMVQIEMAGEVY